MSVYVAQAGPRQGRTFWLQIPIYEAHQVEVFQRGGDFGSVEPGIILCNALPRMSLQRSEEFSTTAILHTQIKVLVRLKRMIERDNERVIAGGKDFLFG